MYFTVGGYAHCPKCGERIEVSGYFHTVSCCNGKVTLTDLTEVSGSHECTGAK